MVCKWNRTTTFGDKNLLRFWNSRDTPKIQNGDLKTVFMYPYSFIKTYKINFALKLVVVVYHWKGTKMIFPTMHNTYLFGIKRPKLILF